MMKWMYRALLVGVLAAASTAQSSAAGFGDYPFHGFVDSSDYDGPSTRTVAVMANNNNSTRGPSGSGLIFGPNCEYIFTASHTVTDDKNTKYSEITFFRNFDLAKASGRVKKAKYMPYYNANYLYDIPHHPGKDLVVLKADESTNDANFQCHKSDYKEKIIDVSQRPTWANDLTLDCAISGFPNYDENENVVKEKRKKLGIASSFLVLYL